jgi:hypothetical protein
MNTRLRLDNVHDCLIGYGIYNKYSRRAKLPKVAKLDADNRKQAKAAVNLLLLRETFTDLTRLDGAVLTTTHKNGHHTVQVGDKHVAVYLTSTWSNNAFVKIADGDYILTWRIKTDAMAEPGTYLRGARNW